MPVRLKLPTADDALMMIRGRRIGLIAAAIIVLLPIAAAAAFVTLFDAETLKIRVADAARRSTGRDLVIAGPIGLTWSLIPTIVLRDVSLSNPPGMSRLAMGRVARIEARVALLPLLSRQIEVRGITLVEPDILLERDAAGRANWQFTPVVVPSAGPVPASKPTTRMQVAIDAVRIRDGRIGWRTNIGVSELLAPMLTAAAAGPNEPVALSGTLAAGGFSVELTGMTGPLAAIDGTSWPLRVVLQGSGMQASADGTLGLAGRELDMAVSARVPDLTALDALAGRALPPVRDMTFDARATTTDTGGLALHGMRLASSQGDVSGDLALTQTPRPALRGTLASQRFDLDVWAARPAAAPPVDALPAAPAGRDPPPKASGAVPSTRMLSDKKLPFDLLRRVDADLHISLNEVSWHGASYRAVAGRLSLQDGRLQVDPLQVQAPGGAMQATVLADAAAAVPTMTFGLQAPGIAAGPLLAAFGAPGTMAGQLDANLQVHGSGDSVRAIAASLDGHLGLAMVDGELDNAWLAGLLGDSVRGLPVELGGRSAVRCLALRFDAVDGQAAVRAMLLDATRLHLEGEGSVNLADETLDLRLRMLVRLGGTSVAVPVHLTGPWRTPRPQVAAGGAGQGALVIGAAPGPDACPAQLAVARDGRTGPMPAASTTQVPRSMKPADLLRSLLR